VASRRKTSWAGLTSGTNPRGFSNARSLVSTLTNNLFSLEIEALMFMSINIIL
jgi:hypothetical protein